MTQIADAILTPGRDGAYDAVLKWALLMALITIGGVVSYDYGLLTYLFSADRSRITVLIAVLYVGFSAHCLWILVELSRENRRAMMWKARLAASSVVPEPPAGGGLVDSYVADLIRARQSSSDEDGDAHLLMMSLGASFRRRTKVGTYGADLLYKLGMLGTMVGFVMMLNSMGDMANFEVETLREALQDMISGMAVSLLTTIAGLIGGILLRLEYNIADALVTDLSQTTVSFTEVSLLPLLARADRDV
ncbi:MotA/TolQ/ExbB proton channel family protein [Ponticoccus sp. SC2-23]|uniref:MotA/TolQ/ExbB proton channel family protein n=1 Tax=Alexandriicola marinus TaxID=2081710 RepID=UPI000FDB0634|nr:MotA/TolQ/ExbB proton channel family protein [Alexandriicola marinus]MBM1218654.1 MotA/TolQ/ExbB proton channel family protein [Ponticoccus sp. SC6-9]MBM1224274.1 MotA/TolQ/ExbB proton channel family protein [Ponticoccus sp. SC6-15]MBM1229947.1 MotA/TolQ/ExbB proton channel family protein [Ponticoccus sp. SC6-38]MBM1233240.1 MotA/TolQ/ExbB proton channel family protein [Ponticoccus sp. SC6-45]MBM1236810.1 MotA/TolQ/ExbB proton channel family protein [Ponticoccus sp. SC6-49]MBM1242251.1 Mot